MKKRLFALLVALALLLGTLPALAAEGSLRNFAASRTYDGRFSDVSTGDWYYSNIVYLFELGLTDGQSATAFGVDTNITVAEALSFAARVHSTYYLGHPEAGALQYNFAGAPWYTPYIQYLKDNQVISTQFDALLGTYATRAQMACILGGVLPAAEFTAINDTVVTMGYATRSFITDVNDYTPYQSQILQLYKWGILTGSDSTGSFYPDSNITRCEFAAMLTRLVNPQLRIKLTWDVSFVYTAKGATYGGLIQGGSTSYTSHALTDTAAADANIRYMLAHEKNTISLHYTANTLTRTFVTELMNLYLQTVRTYIEQGYNAVSCNYSPSTGSVTFRFYSSLFSDNLFPSARQETLEAAIQIHDHLWGSGAITGQMSQLEKARAYYTWVCDNAYYDYRATDTSLSHTAYSLFTMGSAVCDGYTAAYNLLLKLEGISCTTASTSDHIWTVATLDGVTYHIDPTWGDQSGTINYAYFAMTPSVSMARFQ